MSVRNLGLDYSLSTCKSRRNRGMKVHKSRMLKAKHRAARMKNRIKGGSDRVFTTGVLTMPLYGAEHFEVPALDVTNLHCILW